MKINPRLILAGMLLIISQALFSQDNRFIDVIAIDSVELKPVQFIYQISLRDQTEYMGMVIPNKDGNNEEPPAASTIESLLKKNGFSYEISKQNDYTISKNKTNIPAYLVTLNSESELKKLFNTLVSIKGIHGEIKSTNYESISAYKNDIYKRLYAKAMADATLLANVSGNTVGQLISVQEVQQQDSFFNLDYMKQFYNSPVFKDFFGNSKNLAKTVEKKLVFKFQLK